MLKATRTAALLSSSCNLNTALAQRAPAHLWARGQAFQGPGAANARYPLCSSTRIELGAEEEEKARAFVNLLLETNKVMNLTAVQTAEEAWDRHVQDSLALLPVLERSLPGAGGKQRTVIDVGSGAGLPGLILAIARPTWQWTLLDSLKKRCAFVERAVKALDLRNVNVVWARAEAAGQDPIFRQSFDGAVARAVAELRLLAELGLPFVRVGGCFVAAKGAAPQSEAAAAATALKTLGGELEGVAAVHSFGADGQRTAVVIRKVHETPQAYPRREGRPQKRPL